jgi:hypothetical protein
MILALILRHRIPIALAAALLGLTLASWHYRSAYHAEKALRQADRAAYGQAQAEAALIAKRALDATETRYRSKANEADRSHTEALVDARSRADAYIDRMRVKTDSCQASGPTASAQGDDTGRIGKANTKTGMVAVTDADIGICTENTLRLETARNWALGLQTGE